MQKLVLIMGIILVVWFAKPYYQQWKNNHAMSSTESSYTSGSRKNREWNSNSTASTSFSCDGRTHCSQMTSCEEATYFLKNCPNTKMDGNNDGIPCEKQWCK